MYLLPLLGTLLVVYFAGESQAIKHRLRLSFLFFLILPLAHAQVAVKNDKVYVGLDVLKPFLFSLKRGIVLEPMVKVALGHRVYANATLGYCDIRKKLIYNNLTYQNQGVYGKLGIEYFIIPPHTSPDGFVLSAGMNVLYSNFKESGKVILKGAYFGDVTQPLSQSNLEALSIEPTVNYGFLLFKSKRLFLNNQLRLDFLVTQPVGQVFPVNHVPGAGNISHRNEKSPREKGLGITGGITFQLFYKIF